ncbi:uncharacterized protein METZ01_LOCUS232201, partial [marine metagenome]
PGRVGNSGRGGPVRGARILRRVGGRSIPRGPFRRRGGGGVCLDPARCLRCVSSPHAGHVPKRARRGGRRHIWRPGHGGRRGSGRPGLVLDNPGTPAGAPPGHGAGGPGRVDGRVAEGAVAVAERRGRGLPPCRQVGIGHRHGLAHSRGPVATVGAGRGRLRGGAGPPRLVSPNL